MSPELDVWLKVGGIVVAALLAVVGLRIDNKIAAVLIRLAQTDGKLNGHLEMCDLREKNIADKFAQMDRAIHQRGIRHS